jgi:hypothetical protein
MSITLFTSEGHKAIWGTLSTVIFLDILVLRPLPQFLGFLTRPDTKSHRHILVLRPLFQFLGAFSQGQIPTHRCTVWSWGLCLSSLGVSHKARYQLIQAQSHCWLRQVSAIGKFTETENKMEIISNWGKGI